MNNNYIDIYLNLIHEFNDESTKWVKYQNYKNIEIYISRLYVLDRLMDAKRSDLTLLNINIRDLKICIKKFIKQNFVNFSSIVLKNNPQSLFFDISINTYDKILHIYFTGELQFNHIKDCFQICISTFLPNIKGTDEYIPNHNKNDLSFSFSF